MKTFNHKELRKKQI